MNRPLLLAVLLCLSFAPPLNAKSVDCVPDSGCPKGEGPPKCCKPPPCEFFYALKRAKAELRSASMKVQGGALLISADDYEAGWQQYKRNIRDVMRSANSPSAKCPANQFYDPPPALWASRRNGCRITPIAATLERGSKELSLEEL